MHLCQNHTHFIFVDDGSENEFGKEIELRSRLEDEFKNGFDLGYYQAKKDERKSKFKYIVNFL